MGKKHKKHKSEEHYSRESGIDKTPLKLVLKLGSEIMYDSDYAANSPSSTSLDVPIRKLKKRKKKRRHADIDEKELRESVLTTNVSVKPVVDEVSDSSVYSRIPVHTSPAVETEEDIEVQTIVPDFKPPVSPVPPPPFPLTPNMRKGLNNLLEHLLKQLERKDTHEVFAWPVNDMIAPGYSSVISEPMDFSTMRNKIITNQYSNVPEFQTDFELMIDNCCTYNKPDTVYYNIAKKVSSAGLKILSKERLKNVRRSLKLLNNLTKQELSVIFGFLFSEEESIVEDIINTSSNTPLQLVSECADITSDEKVNQNLETQKPGFLPHPDAVSFTDADNADSVAIDAIQAMKEAKKRLEALCPKSRIGFLRMDGEGKTTLNIVNPEANELSKREVDLGALTGSISSGYDVMPEPKEDKRNKVNPIDYLSYGPFGSFAPSYDSRVSNLTQEESDLLLSAYGSETGLLFAKSLEEFVSDCGKTTERMVGDILNTVTHGTHENAFQEIQKKRKKADVDKASQQSIKVNFEELKSLTNLGIDVSFLQEVEMKQKQSKLSSITSYIVE